MPALHRRVVERQTQLMGQAADEVSARWRPGQVVDALPAMRHAALLTLTRALFADDIGPPLRTLWPAIHKTLRFISPGAWLLWPGIPRPGYGRARRALDAYLFALIAARRRAPLGDDDLLSLLLRSGMDDGLVRDQLLTLFIAGHDTSTAALAWTLYRLGRHPDLAAPVRAEVRAVLGNAAPAAAHLDALPRLEAFVKETLRLHPPIHIGNRRAARDLAFGGRRIPAGTRVLCSIYLTHRHPAHWPDPERFDPERFAAGGPRAPLAYIPFGGGARYCMGAAFAQVEIRIILARLLQRFDLALVEPRVREHMGATLEPRPGVRLRVTPRR